MSRAAPDVMISITGFPRVSGDEPQLVMSWAIHVMFFPRERG